MKTHPITEERRRSLFDSYVCIYFEFLGVYHFVSICFAVLFRFLTISFLL
jgi:hypothetical protein